MNTQQAAVAGSLLDSEIAPQHTWVQFNSFEYQGQDKVADELVVGDDEFLNPILAGFHADPSICRAGENYYLVNSSFSFFPGVPIFQSTDLVNWKQLGHVLDRESQLPLDGQSVSAGIFAPDISYHDGVFYIVTTNIGAGNFIVTATDPAGPWSEPIWLRDIHGIDPSLFFDEDGRTYLVHNGAPPEDKPLYEGHRAVWVWEIDTQTGAVKSEGKIVVNGGTDLSKKPIWIEGPHIFKRNGFYYLNCAEGGTCEWHSQVIFRSESVWGPFVPCENNPMLTQRDMDPSRTNPITSVGHADFVETSNGEWWAVFLGCRPYEGNLYNIGRETFLLPVSWHNDWPTILPAGIEVPRVLKRPNLNSAAEILEPQTGSFDWRDDFNVPTLKKDWTFLRNLREEWWALDSETGSLQIAPRDVPLFSARRNNLEANRNPSFIARCQQHRDFSATVSMTINAETASSQAGLAALQNDTNYFFLGVDIHEGQDSQIFLERHTQNSSEPEILACIALLSVAEEVKLKIEGADREYSFSYQLGDGEWVSLAANVDGSILSTDAAGGFVGTFLGMYARTK